VYIGVLEIGQDVLRVVAWSQVSRIASSATQDTPMLQDRVQHIPNPKKPSQSLRWGRAHPVKQRRLERVFATMIVPMGMIEQQTVHVSVERTRKRGRPTVKRVTLTTEQDALSYQSLELKKLKARLKLESVQLVNLYQMDYVTLIVRRGTIDQRLVHVKEIFNQRSATLTARKDTLITERDARSYPSPGLRKSNLKSRLVHVTRIVIAWTVAVISGAQMRRGGADRVSSELLPVLVNSMPYQFLVKQRTVVLGRVYTKRKLRRTTIFVNHLELHHTNSL
jgi:hypothetical protein